MMVLADEGEGLVVVQVELGWKEGELRGSCGSINCWAETVKLAAWSLLKSMSAPLMI